MIHKYFTVRVQFEQIVESKGGNKTRKASEHYLVEAASVTEAEIKVGEKFKGLAVDFQVKSANESKIVEVILD